MPIYNVLVSDKAQPWPSFNFAVDLAEWAASVSITVGPTNTQLRDKFRRLVDWWRDETMDLSSLTDKVLHPAYLRVIGMGSPAVPMVLKELRDAGGWWYPALTAMTEADPVPDSDRGNTDKMTAHWLDWGGREGLI